jgi:hypothetical protein
MMTKPALLEMGLLQIGLALLTKGSAPELNTPLGPSLRFYYRVLFNRSGYDALINKTAYTRLSFIGLLTEARYFHPLKTSVASPSKSLSHFTSTH